MLFNEIGFFIVLNWGCIVITATVGKVLLIQPELLLQYG